MAEDAGSHYDMIIVGAGSAGCVLADRLTRNGRRKVLLVEAGPRDTSPFLHMPRGFGRTLADPRLTWYYPTEPDTHHDEARSHVWLRGKTLGGSSAVNGMIYVRGQPEDYDGWGAGGATGWNAPIMARAFRAVEEELQIEIPQRRTILTDAIIRAAGAAGLPERHDPVGVDGFGIGPTPATISHGRRRSAATAFLRPAERRPNLDVMTDAKVDRVAMDGLRATGIVVDGKIIGAGSVILCAGAIESPALLQRSGIGPAAILRAAGVPIAHDLPGVGGNLREHKLIMTQFELNRRIDDNREFSGWRLLRNALHYGLTRGGPLSRTYDLNAFARSGLSTRRPDIQITFSSFSLDLAAGKLAFDRAPGMQMFAYPLKPTSEGRIDIASPDPAAPPKIRPNYLATDYDRRVTIDAVRLMRKIAAAAPLDELVVRETWPGPIMGDDDQSIIAAAHRDQSCAHAIGTCKMGTDDLAVVDPRLRVRGIEALRVVDCSIMPTQVSGNTNAPAMAVAWRAADLISEDLA